ncbi:MAG: cobalamin-dependent protein [Desulfobacteraceae bacterium]|nr:cobalamin-dependent protein [Desulfobacteraceae bacterium]
MINKFLRQYYNAVYDTDRDEALRVVDEALEKGVRPEEVVFDIIIPAIEKMIKALTIDLDATISQHFIAAQVAEEVTEKMLPLFKVTAGSEGRIIIGTPLGDFHGLGKKIVAGCLRAKMFTVEDIGLNVSPDIFVDKAQEIGAQVIGISSMMAHTATGENGPKMVRKILNERGLAGKIKLVVGGAPYRFDPDLYKDVGADAWADDGITAAEVIRKLVEEVKNETRI